MPKSCTEPSSNWWSPMWINASWHRWAIQVHHGPLVFTFGTFSTDACTDQRHTCSPSLKNSFHMTEFGQSLKTGLKKLLKVLPYYFVRWPFILKTLWILPEIVSKNFEHSPHGCFAMHLKLCQTPAEWLSHLMSISYVPFNSKSTVMSCHLLGGDILFLALIPLASASHFLVRTMSCEPVVRFSPNFHEYIVGTTKNWLDFVDLDLISRSQ